MKNRIVNFENDILVDVSKLNENSFFLLEQVRRASRMTLCSYRFGLLPARQAGEGFSLKSKDGFFHLERCSALTPGGASIEVEERSVCLLRAEEAAAALRRNGASAGYLVVGTSLSKWLPAGEPDPHTPYHQPCLQASYRLEVATDLASFEAMEHWLAVGKITLSGSGGASLDPDHIPPCMAANCHDSLKRLLEKLRETAEKTASCAKNLTAIAAARQAKSPDPLWLALATLTAACRNIFEREQDEVALLLPEMPPIFLFLQVRRMARELQLHLETTPQKAALEARFSKNFGDWQTAAEPLFHPRYDHNDVAGDIRHCGNFLDATAALFRHLEEATRLISEETQVLPPPAVQVEMRPQTAGFEAFGWVLLAILMLVMTGILLVLVF